MLNIDTGDTDVFVKFIMHVYDLEMTIIVQRDLLYTIHPRPSFVAQLMKALRVYNVHAVKATESFVYNYSIYLLCISLHQWLNGSMLACRSGGRGSFPGRCRHMQFGFMLKMEVLCALPCP